MGCVSTCIVLHKSVYIWWNSVMVGVTDLLLEPQLHHLQILMLHLESPLHNVLPVYHWLGLYHTYCTFIRGGAFIIRRGVLWQSMYTVQCMWNKVSSTDLSHWALSTGSLGVWLKVRRLYKEFTEWIREILRGENVYLSSSLSSVSSTSC